MAILCGDYRFVAAHLGEQSCAGDSGDSGSLDDHITYPPFIQLMEDQKVNGFAIGTLESERQEDKYDYQE